MHTGQRFSVGSQIWDDALHSEYDGNASEEKDEDQEEYQLPGATVMCDISRYEEVHGIIEPKTNKLELSIMPMMVGKGRDLVF